MIVCESSALPRSCDCPSLTEDMSFKQLRAVSEPKRIYRAATQVKTNTGGLDLDAHRLKLLAAEQHGRHEPDDGAGQACGQEAREHRLPDHPHDLGPPLRR